MNKLKTTEELIMTKNCNNCVYSTRIECVLYCEYDVLITVDETYKCDAHHLKKEAAKPKYDPDDYDNVVALMNLLKESKVS